MFLFSLEKIYNLFNPGDMWSRMDEAAQVNVYEYCTKENENKSIVLDVTPSSHSQKIGS